MRGRRSTDQQASGDDSFLDIIANIVGILIILIVVAGVRASRAPVDVLPSDAEPSGVEVIVEVAEAVEDGGLEPPPSEVIPAEPWPESVRAPGVSLVDRSDEVTRLVDRLAELSDRVVSSRELLAAVRGDWRELELDLDRLRVKRVEWRAERDGLDAELQVARERLEMLEVDEIAVVRTLEELARSSKRPVVEIRHRLTPVGREVRGVEQHFHVRKGRVARIPLESLKQRVRDQMSRHGRAMSRFPRHEGQVGPVDGFVMEYTVERRPARLVDELRHGRGMVRIAVTRWTIRPEPDLESESIESALSSQSRYQTVLRSSDPGTSLTYWVYPDSFAEMRRLQSAAHLAGFPVAARPLPQGVTISGSPDGTRSQAQ